MGKPSFDSIWFQKIRREVSSEAEKRIEAIKQQYEKELMELDRSSSEGKKKFYIDSVQSKKKKRRNEFWV